MGSEITALGSGITNHGIEISSFLRYQGSGCTIFVESGTKIGHAFRIEDRKFAYKNGNSDEKTYLVTTLGYGLLGSRRRGNEIPQFCINRGDIGKYAKSQEQYPHYLELNYLLREHVKSNFGSFGFTFQFHLVSP